MIQVEAVTEGSNRSIICQFERLDSLVNLL